MSDLPPPPGYTAYLERSFQPKAPPEPLDTFAASHEGAPEPLRHQVTDAVVAVSAELIELSHDIHAHPELGFEEHHAVAAVARLLDKHGHDADVGAFGLPTALRARAGDGRPTVALLAEYDALPGIGHACGHNIICATAVGGFLALAEHAADFGGSVELIGTPAEEGGGGKELMARQGAFDEVDAVLMLHPGTFEVAEHPWIGVRQLEVVYRGAAAHAAASPFLGRNALDAVVAAYNGLAQLRQHILPTERVHCIITDGGQKPNIVPERAAASIYVRSVEPETLLGLSERVEAILSAAALSTGTQMSVQWDPCPPYLPVRTNRVLAARYATNLSGRGRRVLPRGAVPEYLTGSTDLGNVSCRVPSIHPVLQVAPPGVAIHDPEFARHAVGEAADQGVVDGAIALALTAADFLMDPGLRDATVKEFEDAGGRIDPQALLA